MAMEEELLTMLAYMSMEQTDKAQALFVLLDEYYPDSAGAQAAVADFFESKGDIEGALRHARKAFAISGSDADRDRVEALANRH
jgi:hypothetical protein